MPESKPSVRYTEKAIVITIPTTSPEAFHKLLMHGITASLRHCLNSEQKKKEVEGLTVLTDLLDVLLPDEKVLATQLPG